MPNWSMSNWGNPPGNGLILFPVGVLNEPRTPGGAPFRPVSEGPQTVAALAAPRTEGARIRHRPGGRPPPVGPDNDGNEPIGAMRCVTREFSDSECEDDLALPQRAM